MKDIYLPGFWRWHNLFIWQTICTVPPSKYGDSKIILVGIFKSIRMTSEHKNEIIFVFINTADTNNFEVNCNMRKHD